MGKGVVEKITISELKYSKNQKNIWRGWGESSRPFYKSRPFCWRLFWFKAFLPKAFLPEAFFLVGLFVAKPSAQLSWGLG